MHANERWKTDPEYRERQTRLHKEWITAHPEKQKEYNRRNYERHREKRIRASVESRRKNAVRATETTKKWRHSKPKEWWQERHLKNRLWFRFKLTKEWYDEKLLEQDGRCAICRTPVGKIRFCVDHDHKTGKIRGLLCRACNFAIHKGERDMGWFSDALAYLKLYD